ncbi:MAG TPA: arginine--tRNA ligase [Bacteroidia bacterium]|nr:arginine--tRNA ligase [Bacteroidia bacterium]
MISSIEHSLSLNTITAAKKIFDADIQPSQIQFQQTKKEFEGDITLVVFPLTKFSKKSPEETGKLIGEYLQQQSEVVTSYNCVKGFLNIVIDNTEWLKQFAGVIANPRYGFTDADANQKPVMLEYASPNTNKPIHLGHMRNILLGWSVVQLLKATGKKVFKTSIINDRGIHICKSMLAWKLFGNGETPQSSGMKGDHLVGKYYVEFDKQFKKEKLAVGNEQLADNEGETDEKNLPLMKDAKSMLIKWEQGDKETIDLWKMMNGWVYDGFDVTYKNLGIDFDKIYYESDTYLLGKKIVEEGLQKKIFTQDADNSVWLDLTDEGLDRKIMQRSDGTSVYITQDLGTATLRHKEFDFDSMIYVVGNEQDYHFKVLFKALKKLGYNWADKCHHLSYAMVDLPSGKMKSREGTVVDADELMQEVIDAAKAETQKLGKVDEFSAEELNQLYKTLGMGALKYFILKVDPEKRMLFNPEESVEIHGNTGPYIQYVHARICSMLRSAGKADELSAYAKYDVTRFNTLNDKEKELLKTILSFAEVVKTAAQKLSPALVANYVYELSRVYNQFYHENTVIDKAEKETSLFRLQLSSATAHTIKKCMELLGIDCPERM